MVSGYYLAGVLVLLVLGQGVAGSRDVIDREQLDDGSIIGQLCDHNSGHNKIISRISSIGKLHGYLSALPEAEQGACRDFYLKPLDKLKSLVDAGAENVCSASVMEQIDAFHWDYIVGGLSKRWRKASVGSLPEPLKVFFINYAQEVTEKCKDTLKDRLEVAARSKEVAAGPLNTGNFGMIVNQMSNVLQPKDKMKNHGDFLLLWDHIIDKEHKKGNLIAKKVDPATGETTYLSIKVKDPPNVWLVQKKCRQELRPIYQQTVLPVMRFITLGYGDGEKQSREDVANSELVKEWYAITQLCQLLVPIDFYSDKSMKDEQTAVLSMEEARNLPTPEESLASGETPAVEVKSVQLEDVLPHAEKDGSKPVKSNMKSITGAYRRVFRNILRMARGGLKSKLKNLFVSKKVAENKFVIEGGEEIERQLAEGEKELLQDDDDDENHRGSLVRSKRQEFSMKFELGFAAVLLGIVVVATALIMGIIFLATHFG